MSALGLRGALGALVLTGALALSTSAQAEEAAPAADNVAGVMQPAPVAESYQAPNQRPLRYALFAIAFLVFAAVVGANDRPQGDAPASPPPS